MPDSNRNLYKEINDLKNALNDALSDLFVASNHLHNDRTQWAEDELENVYFQLFKLAEKSDKLKALIAEGERKAKSKYPTHRGDLDNE